MRAIDPETQERRDKMWLPVAWIERLKAKKSDDFEKAISSAAKEKGRMAEALMFLSQRCPDRLVPQRHLAEIFDVDYETVQMGMKTISSYILNKYNKIVYNERGVGYKVALHPDEAVIEEAKTHLRAVAHIRKLIKTLSHAIYDYSDLTSQELRDLNELNQRFAAIVDEDFRRHVDEVNDLMDEIKKQRGIVDIGVSQPRDEDTGELVKWSQDDPTEDRYDS